VHLGKETMQNTAMLQECGPSGKYGEFCVPHKAVQPMTFRHPSTKVLMEIWKSPGNLENMQLLHWKGCGGLLGCQRFDR
jgi:hypothetical protein